MGLFLTIAAAGIVLAATVAVALRYGIRDIWDGILALLVFSAVFGMLGEELARAAEATLLSLGLVSPATTGFLLASSAVAVNAAAILACALLLLARRARLPGRP